MDLIMKIQNKDPYQLNSINDNSSIIQYIFILYAICIVLFFEYINK